MHNDKKLQQTLMEQLCAWHYAKYFHVSSSLNFTITLWEFNDVPIWQIRKNRLAKKPQKQDSNSQASSQILCILSLNNLSKIQNYLRPQDCKASVLFKPCLIRYHHQKCIIMFSLIKINSLEYPCYNKHIYIMKWGRNKTQQQGQITL